MTLQLQFQRPINSVSLDGFHPAGGQVSCGQWSQVLGLLKVLLSQEILITTVILKPESQWEESHTQVSRQHGKPDLGSRNPMNRSSPQEPRLQLNSLECEHLAVVSLPGPSLLPPGMDD